MGWWSKVKRAVKAVVRAVKAVVRAGVRAGGRWWHLADKGLRPCFRLARLASEEVALAYRGSAKSNWPAPD